MSNPPEGFPKGPNTTRLFQILAERPIPTEALVEEMISLGRLSNSDDLPAIVKIGQMCGLMDEIFAEPALLLLPCWGERGLDAFFEMVATNSFYSSIALTLLVAIAHGEKVQVLSFREAVDAPYQLTGDLQRYALIRLRKLVLEHFAHPSNHTKLISILSSLNHKSADSPEGRAGEYLFSNLFESRLAINRYLIEEYETLLASVPKYEREIQDYLIKHPVLLDPLAVQVYDRHSLGDDLKTDFVIRQITNDYVLVEIEKSSDPLFTASDDFTHLVTHAVGQVTAFQTWITDNIAYAQTKLPGIRRPSGLVVIGRSTDLGDRRQRKLLEENFSRRQHVQIVTFDHLLQQAKTIYRNMLEGPPIS